MAQQIYRKYLLYNGQIIPVILYLDRLKKDGNEMHAEAERQNCETLFRDLKDKHVSEIKSRLVGIEKEEKYYNKTEIRFHLDTDIVLMFIQGLGRIRLKSTLDRFQVSLSLKVIYKWNYVHIIVSNRN